MTVKLLAIKYAKLELRKLIYYIQDAQACAASCTSAAYTHNTHSSNVEGHGHWPHGRAMEGHIKSASTELASGSYLQGTNILSTPEICRHFRYALCCGDTSRAGCAFGGRSPGRK